MKNLYQEDMKWGTVLRQGSREFTLVRGSKFHDVLLETTQLAEVAPSPRYSSTFMFSSTFVVRRDVRATSNEPDIEDQRVY